MNKHQQELLDKCKKLKYEDEPPLLSGIYIIQQRRLHDSGYRMMYVIGHTYREKEYYLLSTYSDVIDINNLFSDIDKYDLHLDIDRYGIIHIWSNKNFKSIYRVSTCSFDIVGGNNA